MKSRHCGAHRSTHCESRVMFLRHNFMFTLMEMLLKRVCSMLSRIIAVQSLYYQFSVYQAVKTYLQVLTDKASAL